MTTTYQNLSFNWIYIVLSPKTYSWSFLKFFLWWPFFLINIFFLEKLQLFVKKFFIIFINGLTRKWVFSTVKSTYKTSFLIYLQLFDTYLLIREFIFLKWNCKHPWQRPWSQNLPKYDREINLSFLIALVLIYFSFFKISVF